MILVVLEDEIVLRSGFDGQHFLVGFDRCVVAREFPVGVSGGSVRRSPVFEAGGCFCQFEGLCQLANIGPLLDGASVARVVKVDPTENADRHFFVSQLPIAVGQCHVLYCQFPLPVGCARPVL